MAPPILRIKHPPKNKTRNVSFASKTSINTTTKYSVDTNPSFSSNSNNKNTHSTNKTTHFLHDEEEDAFDPSGSIRKGDGMVTMMM